MSTPTPHDALFKATFSDLGRAAEVLRHVLSPEVAALIDFSTLALEDGTFIDEELRDRHVDRLYSAKMAGKSSLIYLLYEHKSKDERMTPLWMLIYMTQIHVSLLRDAKLEKLPVILGVVLHHSEQGWRSATRFEDLLDLPDEVPDALWALVPRYGFVLDDLGSITDEELRRRAMSAGTRLLLSALQQVRSSREVEELIRGWASLLRDLHSEANGGAALELAMCYLRQVRNLTSRGIIEVLAREVGPREAKAMETLRNLWREEAFEEGRLEGSLRGELRGERTILLRMLRRRFGELPASVLARIEAADTATLERWSEELLDARALTDLFPAAGGPASAKKRTRKRA